MKRGLLLVFCTFLAINIAGSATAVPLFSKHFTKLYADKEKDADYAAKVKAEKCNVCPFGKKKKNKHDFGVALSKYLKKDKFKSSRVKAEPKKVETELNDAFKKVLEVKNKDGKTFEELIKAGKLPGTAPDDAK